MGIQKLILLLTFAACPILRADGPGRIYTKTSDADAGIITGKVVGTVLTHAIAIERDGTRVYLATLENNGAGFRFAKLPVGRFDLVLVTKDNRVIEGLTLGENVKLPADRDAHLETGIAKADSFFNRRIRHRAGIEEEKAFVFVERIRDGEILRGSGEKIDACLRRLEIIELHEADDEWQMVKTRHLYREETPLTKGIPFLTHLHLPSLGGIRVADSPRDLGTIDLTKH